MELAGDGDYSLASWDERQGLPSGRIWAISQDATGYLWLATEGGPIRFDGVRFVPWRSDDGTSSSEDLGVSSLHPASDGSVWLGFNAGGIGRIRDGRLERYGKSAGIGYGRIRFVVEDRTGTIWAGNASGIYWFRDGRWESDGKRVGLPQGVGFDAHEDREGNFWIASGDGIFRRPVRQEKFERVGHTERLIRFSDDATGTMWITDFDRGFKPILGPRRQDLARWVGLGYAITHDRHGTMWIGTRGQGLWRVRHDSKSNVSIQTITVADGLSSNIVRSVFEDRDGNVWVGTDSGLHRFTPSKVTPLTNIGFTWAVQATPDGHIWVATSTGLLEFAGDSRRRYSEEDGLPSAFVRALFADVHGTLWVATDRGVARKAGARFERLTPDDLSLSTVTSLAADSRGRLWLSDRERGALSWGSDGLTTVTPPGASGAAPNFVYVDRRDRLWMGFQGATVTRIENGRETEVHAFGGGVGAALTAVYEDRNGAIWVGGSRGLARIYDGRVDVVSQPDDLPGYGVFAITEDVDGHIWLGVSSGIVRLKVSDFERAARQPQSELSYRLYDASDGLGGVPARQGLPGAARATDGTLWFNTSRGASVITPQRMYEPGGRSTLRIETVHADDRPVPLAPSAALPPGTSRLLFEYTALNLTSPLKDRFEYRLEGVDADWVSAGTRREAFYPNLRSGTYRFHVAILADDTAVSRSTATWKFTIRPMYYETWWFMTGCVGLAGLMAWSAWQLRLRQLRRQFAVVFAERARMGRELHDTVLQDLVGVALHFDELASTVGTKEPATGQIIRLRRYLERSIQEARHAIWDLRSASLEEGGIPKALQELGERTFEGNPARFTLTVTGTPRRCDRFTEQHLLRIAREALCNAARHAQATFVHLSLEYKKDHVVLRISDDGCGCQASDRTGELLGHYGFQIMRERAAQAKGQFRINTGPGRGTEIEVAISV
jgi:signal transduction histidine kinase/ligand-binding sensor domain-containing protein